MNESGKAVNEWPTPQLTRVGVSRREWVGVATGTVRRLEIVTRARRNPSLRSRRSLLRAARFLRRSRGSLVQGEPDSDDRAAALCRCQLERAVVTLNDRVRDAQPETGPFAERLGREEGVEHALTQVLWNAVTGVGHGNYVVVSVCTGSN